MTRLIRIWALIWGLAALTVYTVNYWLIRKFGSVILPGFARTRWVRWMEKWIEPLFLLSGLMALMGTLLHDVWTTISRHIRRAGS